MRLAERHAVEDILRRGVGIVLRLRQRNERLSTKTFQRRIGVRRVEHHVGEQRECRLELVLESGEANRARLLANRCEDGSPQHLLRVGKLIGGLCLRALAEHARRERGDTKLVWRFIVRRAADEVDVQRDDGEVMLLVDDERRAVGELGLGPLRNAK